MKYLLFIITLSISLSFASTFKLKKSLKNTRLNSIANTAKSIISNEKIFGDCGDVQKFKVSKTKNEKNINTIKQLLVIADKIDAGNDEQEYVTVINPKDTFSLAKTVLDFTMDDQVQSWLNNNDDFILFQKKENELAKSIYLNTDKLKNKNLKYYQSIHSYEDGTWNSLTIYDTNTQEALIITVGFCST